MQKNKIIEFLRQKDYQFLKDIGQGGTGKTILIKDETIDEVFVCKKYSPFYDGDKEMYFRYFLDEIKILYCINHKNIVRVFNYYLYPESITGYILMEYVEGDTISEYIYKNPDRLNDIFLQTIEGFRYLEEKSILHRDIRPDNVIVSEHGVVKIIDFGFGKRIDFLDAYDKSITLNWRYSPPGEFNNSTYDFKTEVYFVGKLFEEMIRDLDSIEFNYLSTISKMIEANYDKRINSFFDVYRDTINENSDEFEFNMSEKYVYQNFASSLVSIFGKMSRNCIYRKNLDYVVRDLDDLHRNSILEDYVQNSTKLTNCFVSGQYNYFPKKEVSVQSLHSFIKLIKSVSEDKRKIIFNNLWERFDKIERYTEVTTESDDLPF